MSSQRSLLGGVLSLGEIENVESFCRTVLDERLKALGAFLNQTEHDDALSYLIAEAWLLHKRFDPSRGTRFSTFAYRILSRRVASWYRQRFVDGRYHATPTLLNLDDADLVELLDLDESTEAGRINVAALTPDGRMILTRLARPMVEEDLSIGQIARRFGYGRRWSRDALDRLRDELAPMLNSP